MYYSSGGLIRKSVRQIPTGTYLLPLFVDFFGFFSVARTNKKRLTKFESSVADPEQFDTDPDPTFYHLTKFAMRNFPSNIGSNCQLTKFAMRKFPSNIGSNCQKHFFGMIRDGGRS